MTEEHASPEKAMKQIQRLFKKRGAKALEMARKEVLAEKVECKEVREALFYFMNEYWHDLARPSLLSLVCEAVGGDPEATTPVAIPMMLISGAIDIHDDIIDQSKIKNGKPTIYGKYGSDIALLVGDALMFKGLTLFDKAATGNDISTKKMRVVMNIVKDMFFELGDAEALELKFRGNLDVSPDEYLRVVRKKAADVEAHTSIGAFLGATSPKKVDALGKYGRLLGMLILLRDDWIDIIDIEECRNRIRTESLPLPLLFGLQDPVTRDRLGNVLLKKTFTRKDVQTISDIMEKTSVFQKYANLMSGLAEDAVKIIRKHKIKQQTLELMIRATLLS